MSIGPLKTLLASAAAVGVVAGPMTGATHAQEAPVVRASSTVVPVIFVENARTEAREWASQNPDDIVFSVYYGTRAPFEPEFIQQRLIENAQEHGCFDGTKVFFERVEGPGTGFDVRYSGLYEANLNINQIMPFTEEEAGPHKCAEDNLLLAGIDR